MVKKGKNIIDHYLITTGSENVWCEDVIPDIKPESGQEKCETKHNF